LVRRRRARRRRSLLGGGNGCRRRLYALVGARLSDSLHFGVPLAVLLEVVPAPGAELAHLEVLLVGRVPALVDELQPNRARNIQCLV
jgi:hypothetical protein